VAPPLPPGLVHAGVAPWRLVVVVAGARVGERARNAVKMLRARKESLGVLAERARVAHGAIHRSRSKAESPHLEHATDAPFG